MSDLISRQAAIEALREEFKKSPTTAIRAMSAIKVLPPAQPEKRTEERAKTHACDLIDRWEAIDALKDMYHAAEKWGEEASDEVIKARAESCMASLVEMKLRIEKLPSAQREIITCKECKYKDENCRRACTGWLPCMDAQTGGDWYCGSAKRGEQNG